MLEQDEFFIHLSTENGLSQTPGQLVKHLPRRINLYTNWKVALTHIATSVKFKEKISVLPTILVKTNIIEESIYNNQSLPVLRLITLTREWLATGLYSENFPILEYVPVKIKSFDHLIIDLQQTVFDSMQVTAGQIIVTLHFKRC